MQKTITEWDYWCRLHNKAMIIHHGGFVGLIQGYKVGKIENEMPKEESIIL